jgi:hypothetical protein
MEETASRDAGYFPKYCISSCGHPKEGDPPAWGLGGGVTTHRKTSILRRNVCYTGSQTWRAFVNTVVSFRVPKKAGNFLNSLATQFLKKDSALWRKLIVHVRH